MRNALIGTAIGVGIGAAVWELWPLGLLLVIVFVLVLALLLAPEHLETTSP